MLDINVSDPKIKIKNALAPGFALAFLDHLSISGNNVTAHDIRCLIYLFINQEASPAEIQNHLGHGQYSRMFQHLHKMMRRGVKRDDNGFDWIGRSGRDGGQADLYAISEKGLLLLKHLREGSRSNQVLMMLDRMLEHLTKKGFLFRINTIRCLLFIMDREEATNSDLHEHLHFRYNTDPYRHLRSLDSRGGVNIERPGAGLIKYKEIPASRGKKALLYSLSAKGMKLREFAFGY